MYTCRCPAKRVAVNEVSRTHPEKTRKDIDDMAAIFSEFIIELIKFVFLIAVSLFAIFCGKKLRDRKDVKNASDIQSGK